MEENHPIAFARYKTALEDFSVDSLENWITYIKNTNDATFYNILKVKTSWNAV